MIGQMGLAGLAAVDSLAVEVNVVCQTHVVSWAAARFEPYFGRRARGSFGNGLVARQAGGMDEMGGYEDTLVTGSRAARVRGASSSC